MRISCLQPDLFAVHEAMLETLCLCSYILFHTFRKKTFFNFSHTPLLQTLTITKHNIRIKENEEPILQLGANMRISCLQPDLFAVHEAMLETLCLCSYILFHTFRKKTFFNFSHTPLLQTLTITNTKCPK